MAILSPVFIYVLIALFDTGLMYLRDTTLSGAVELATRAVRTDSIGGATEAKFKQLVCDNAFAIPNCQASIRVNVEAYDDFAKVAYKAPVDAGGAWQPMGFDAGKGSSIVLASAYYKHKSFVPTLPMMPKVADGTVLLSATAVVRNEPF